MSSRRKVRLWTFWMSSLGSTILFFLFMATMMVVPGILLETKLWMLSLAGLAAAISLVIGLWRFASTDAPVADRPFGPIIAVVLLIEMAECGISLVQLAKVTHR